MIKETIGNFILVLENIKKVNNNLKQHFSTFFNDLIEKDTLLKLQLKNKNFIKIIEILFPNLWKNNINLLILQYNTCFDNKLKYLVLLETLYDKNLFLNIQNFKSKLFYEYCLVNNVNIYKNKYWLKFFKKIFFNKKINNLTPNPSVLKYNNFEKIIGLNELINIIKLEIPNGLKLNEEYANIKLKKYFYLKEFYISKQFLKNLIDLILNNKFWKINIRYDNEITVNNLKNKFNKLYTEFNNESKIKNIYSNSYFIIKNIFKSYSLNKYNLYKNNQLFDNYKISLNYINFSEFNKFIEDYKIYVINKSKILEIYKYVKNNIYGINSILFFNIILLLSTINKKDEDNFADNLNNFIDCFRLNDKYILKNNTNKNQNLLNKSWDYVRSIEAKNDKIPLFARTKLKKKFKKKLNNFNFYFQEKQVAERLYKQDVNKYSKKNSTNLKNISILNSIRSSNGSYISNNIKDSYLKRKKYKNLVKNQNTINWENINKINLKEFNLSTKHSNLNDYFKVNKNKNSLNKDQKNDKKLFLNYGKHKSFMTNHKNK